MKHILMIGDSIAHGWGSKSGLGFFAEFAMLLQKKRPEYIFTNASQYGENIIDAYHRTAKDILIKKPDEVIINIGINDIRRRKNSDLNIDISEGLRIEYWNKLLDAISISTKNIIVLDLLPVVEDMYTENAGLIRYNKDVIRYNQIIEEICKQRGIKLIKRNESWAKKDLHSLYIDATHPNQKAHSLLAQELFEKYVN